jgi:hypothetical protein
MPDALGGMRSDHFGCHFFGLGKPPAFEVKIGQGVLEIKASGIERERPLQSVFRLAVPF